MSNSNHHYGSLQPMEDVSKRKKNSKALFKCVCGVEKYIRIAHVISGATTSCGCYKSYAVSTKRTGLSHIVSKTRLYRIWGAMKQRCYNVKSTSYKNYGEKGIKVCDEWLEKYSDFYGWAIANGYSDNLTIDRIDVNLGYSQENCRWITSAENTKRMLEVNYTQRKGQFSKEALNELSSKNKKNLGLKISILLDGIVVENCDCLISAAQYIKQIRGLDTNLQSIKKNISACIHGKRNKCHGFTFKLTKDIQSF